MLKSDDDRAAQSQQTLALESLAAELSVPVEEVRRTYHQQLARLKADARVPDFLFVFALRSTRNSLKSSGH